MELPATEVYNGVSINRWQNLTDEQFINLTVQEVEVLEFLSWEDAHTFYVKYAMMHGFGVRKCNMGKNKAGECTWRSFVCCFEGYRVEKFIKKENRKRQHKYLTRFGCNANLRVQLNGDTRKWFVTYFVDEHSHELLGVNYSTLLRSHRKMTPSDIAQLNSMRDAGLKPAHGWHFFAGQSGGFEKVGFLKKDIYNHIASERTKAGGDAIAALSYLSGLADNDNIFFMRHTVDADGRLEHLFWCDGMCRIDYKSFGQVLAFDTTYRRNKYDKPLVIFSGVNHHRSTVVFGGALVSDEREHTYVWLLETFMEAMAQKKPASVVTDGDMSMRNAIKHVFPEAKHRLCAWHLAKNAHTNIPRGDFRDDFKRCMLGDFEIGEFEERWALLMQQYDVESNKWVQDVYSKKKLWATEYLRRHFWAGLRTTSRCEAMHAHIGKFVKHEHNLYDFFFHFQRGLQYFRNNEMHHDFKSIYGVPVLVSALVAIEKSASVVYTKASFQLFRKELAKSAAMKIISREDRGRFREYVVSRYCSVSCSWKVVFNWHKINLYCSCARMDSVGIPCAHMIVVMKYEDLRELPEKIVLKRWRKDAKRMERSIVQDDDDSERLLMHRQHVLLQTCRWLCNLASKRNEDFHDVRDKLGVIVTSLEVKHGRPMNEIDSRRRTYEGDSSRDASHVKDPIAVKMKGRPIGVSSSFPRKKRCCGLCRKGGHIRRHCPENSHLGSNQEINNDTSLESETVNLGWSIGNFGEYEAVDTFMADRGFEVHEEFRTVGEQHSDPPAYGAYQREEDTQQSRCSPP